MPDSTINTKSFSCHTYYVYTICQTTAGGSMSANASKYIIISYIKLYMYRETKIYIYLQLFS